MIADWLSRSMPRDERFLAPGTKPNPGDLLCHGVGQLLFLVPYLLILDGSPNISSILKGYVKLFIKLLQDG